MRKYLGIFQNYFLAGIEYRSELITLALLELIKTGSILALWLAIFRSIDQINQIDKPQIIQYYLLIPLVGHLTGINISSLLGWEIKDGTFSNYLLKPYRIWIASLMRTLVKKANLLIILLPLYAILITVFTSQTPIKISNLVIAIIASAAGLFLHFMIDLIITWSAFWLEDVWFFSHLKNIVFGIFSGRFFPFQFLPLALLPIFNFLPFKYLYYVPINYLISDITPQQYLADATHISTWIIFLFIVSIWLWKKGITKYEAYGR